MAKGAVTDGYKADRNQVLKVLNDVLATEIVCVLRYKRHFYMAQGINSDSVKAEFLQHANEEQQHADWVAERITQLGGEPNFDPEGLSNRSHSEYKAGKTLTDMIKEDLIAETNRNRVLFGDRAMARQRRSDDTRAHRADPEDGRRAR
jgi:bacterioferritin